MREAGSLENFRCIPRMKLIFHCCARCGDNYDLLWSAGIIQSVLLCQRAQQHAWRPGFILSDSPNPMTDVRKERNRNETVKSWEPWLNRFCNTGVFLFCRSRSNLKCARCSCWHLLKYSHEIKACQGAAQSRTAYRMCCISQEQQSIIFNHCWDEEKPCWCYRLLAEINQFTSTSVWRQSFDETKGRYWQVLFNYSPLFMHISVYILSFSQRQ